MKRILLIATVLILGNSYGQDSLNLRKLSGWTSPSATKYNDIWGYAAEGREYVILGSNWGTHFLDITDPTNPVEVNSFIGKNSNSTWRDFKTMDHYAYGVGDGGNHSLQIFDLQYLPDSVVKVYDNDSLSTSSHSIFIDNNRAYLSGTRRGGPIHALEVLDLTNPIAPTLMASIEAPMFGGCSGCLHDTYVRNDTAYCSAGYSKMFIYDFKDLNSPVLINTIGVYTDDGNNHSSWLSEDGKHLVMADEVPHGLAMNLFDVSDLNNIVEVDTFTATLGSTAHNPFILGNEIYVSHYLDGVQIFNFEDPTNVKKSAFYDTYPDNVGYGYFNGCWGVYPYLPSRNIIASDITYGLFVLGKQQDVYLNQAPIEVCQNNDITVGYTAVGSYDSLNSFYLVMSDTNQSFDNSTIIGSTPADSSGNITAHISSSIKPGTYRIRVQSSNPLLVESTYLLLKVSDFLPKPTFDASQGGDCIHVVNDSNLTYQWHNGLTVISGATGSSYCPTVSGQYCVTATESSTGCQSGPNCVDHFAEGIYDVISSNFSVYPNPTSDFVFIENKEVVSYYYTIRDYLGRQIEQGQSNRKLEEINVSKLEKGIYFVDINFRGKTKTQKLLIE